MPAETTPVPEINKITIDRDVRTAFRSIRSSLKNLGFPIIPSADYRMSGLSLTYELSGEKIEAIRRGVNATKELPKLLKTSDSAVGVGWNLSGPKSRSKGLGMNLAWKTESGKFEEMVVHYFWTDTEKGHFLYERSEGKNGRPVSGNRDRHVIYNYEPGVLEIFQPAQQSIKHFGTINEWLTEEKPILEEITSTLKQAAMI